MSEYSLTKGFNWFKYMTIAVVLLFVSVMVFVLYTAQTRQYSGRTGLDASQMREMRHAANLKYCEDRLAERNGLMDEKSP